MRAQQRDPRPHLRNDRLLVTIAKDGNDRIDIARHQLMQCQQSLIRHCIIRSQLLRLFAGRMNPALCLIQRDADHHEFIERNRRFRTDRREFGSKIGNRLRILFRRK